MDGIKFLFEEETLHFGFIEKKFIRLGTNNTNNEYNYIHEIGIFIICTYRDKDKI